MAAPKAPTLGGREGGTLDESVFAAEVKPHLVHEAVRAELNAQRAGTRAAKSRGMVSGGRGKPWRQKGTGRARAGTIRAAQFTGGGVVFPPSPRRFDVKVNKKAYRSALRSALSAHVEEGTLAIVDPAVVRRAVDARPRSACSRSGARSARSSSSPCPSRKPSSSRSATSPACSWSSPPRSRSPASSGPARCVVTEAALELLQKRAVSEPAS